MDPIPHSQHRPIIVDVAAAVVLQQVPLRRRFNFRKANCEKFTFDLDEAIAEIDPTPAYYDEFIEVMQVISKRHVDAENITSLESLQIVLSYVMTK